MKNYEKIPFNEINNIESYVEEKLKAGHIIIQIIANESLKQIDDLISYANDKECKSYYRNLTDSDKQLKECVITEHIDPYYAFKNGMNKYYNDIDINEDSQNVTDNLSKTLFSAVQHAFAEKYFQMEQEINPQIDMKAIRHDGGEYLKLLYETLEKITIDQLKGAVMYAFDYGTEEIEESKIPYVKTVTENIAKAIKSGLTEIESVHINYLDSDAKKEDISIDKFVDYLLHLSRSGIFANAINWRYVDLFDSGKFLLEGDIGHNNGYELNVAIVAKNIEDKDKVVKILGESEE